MSEQIKEQDTWIIWFDDPSMKAEVFTGEGAQEAAQKRFDALSDNWTVTLCRSVPASASSQECGMRKALTELQSALDWLERQHDKHTEEEAELRYERARGAARDALSLSTLCGCEQRIAELREELRVERERLDLVISGLSHIHACDGKHYWYHSTSGEMIGDGSTLPDARAAIDAARERKEGE